MTLREMALEDELLARAEKELAALVARSRALMQRRQFAEASRLIGDGYRALFGLDRRFLQMMQPQEVAALLGRPEKLRAFAVLMIEEAQLLHLQHDEASAAATARWTLRTVEAGKLHDEPLLARLRAMLQLLGP